MLALGRVSERGCGKERLVSTGSALSSMLLLPGSGISLALVSLQPWRLLGLWDVLDDGTSLAVVSPWCWHLPGPGIFLVLVSLWFWLLPGSGLSPWCWKVTGARI